VDTRGQIVQASREAEMATLKARAAISLAEGEAGAKKINAEADANVLRVTGEAKGLQTRSIGQAEADVLKRKVDAVGQVNYSVMEILNQLAASKTPIVPQISLGGGGGSSSESLAGALVGMLVAQMVNQK
jgi:uncharacterized membrane protein YqiK